MPYDIIEVGQHGFRKWLGAVTWTPVDLSSVRSGLLWYSPEGNFTEMLEISVFDISLEITNLRLQPHLPGATEFKLAASYHKKKYCNMHTTLHWQKIKHTPALNPQKWPMYEISPSWQVMGVSYAYIFLIEFWLFYNRIFNTLRPRYKMAAILQIAFSNAISWMKIYEFRLRFHWSFFLRVKLTIFQHWFR